MKVRFYFGDRDYDGKILDVRRITLLGNKSGKVETMQDERFDCTDNFVLMEETQVKVDRQTGHWVIIPA
jgi:hypothetical protein